MVEPCSNCGDESGQHYCGGEKCIASLRARLAAARAALDTERAARAELVRVANRLYDKAGWLVEATRNRRIPSGEDGARMELLDALEAWSERPDEPPDLARAYTERVAKAGFDIGLGLGRQSGPVHMEDIEAAWGRVLARLGITDGAPDTTGGDDDG